MAAPPLDLAPREELPGPMFERFLCGYSAARRSWYARCPL